MADELFEVRDGELSDDEPFYINPKDERSSYPFTDGELMEDVKRFFRAYIFTKPSREVRAARVGWCSCCGAFLDEGEMAAAVKTANGGMLAKWHNADAECPQCGRMATVKEDFRMRSYNGLFEDRMIAYIHVAAADLIYIRVFDTAVRYGADEPEGDFYPIFGSEKYRYRLRPGEWVCEKNQENWYGARARFVRAKTPLDESVNKPLDGICGAARLEKSFMRYHQGQTYYDNCGEKTAYNGSYYKGYEAYYPMKYLCRFAEYPQTEMVQKLGLHWAVNDLVNENRKNARLLDWNAKTVDGFLRLDRQTAKAYLTAGASRDLIKLYRACKGTFDMQTLDAAFRAAGDRAEELVRALQSCGLSLAQARNYVEKKKITLSDWLDYIGGARQIGYDLTVHNVALPKDFHEAHDAAIRGLSLADFRKLTKAQQRKLKARAKKYEWRIGGYVFRFPLAAREIVEEGKALGHCVGGYAGRHMDGKTNIVFLRRADTPDKSLYTIEIDGAEVRQAYGAHNRIKPQNDGRVAACYRLWQMHVAKDLRLRLRGSFDKLKYKEKRPCLKTAS